MARYNQVTNRRVDRSAAERLQQKLYEAAEAALDQAIESGTIPAALLSSTQAILRDADLSPDLSVEDDPDDYDEEGAEPLWVSNLNEEFGL